MQTDQITVGEEEIAGRYELDGDPVSKLAEEESQRLLKMESILHEKVIGQDEAVEAVSRAIEGLVWASRSETSHRFVHSWPTGVGKTELSKALAEALFGDGCDDSNYCLNIWKHTVARLIGAPPGYVDKKKVGADRKSEANRIPLFYSMKSKGPSDVSMYCFKY